MKRLVFPCLAAAIVASAVLAPAASAAPPTRTVVRDLTSATGQHVWYQWQGGGLALYDGIQVVNTAPNGRTTGSAPARGDLTLSGSFVLDAAAAQAAATAAVNAGAGADVSSSRVAFAQGAQARRAWLVHVTAADAPGDYEVVVDAQSGAV